MKKRLFVFFTVLSVLLANVYYMAQAGQQQISVLLYHHILPVKDAAQYWDSAFVISQESFRAQMEFLHDNNYHTVSSDELRSFLYNKKPLPAKSVMITFDDGYMSNYLFAYPILKQYGFTAVLFAITGNIQTLDQEYHPKQLDMLSWMQVEASKDVFEYGSHTNALHNTDANGRTGFITASLDSAAADLQHSLKRLDNTKLFAFPSGQYNDQLVNLIKNNGVDLAFTDKAGYVGPGSNPLLLNRVTIYRNIDLQTFKSIASCSCTY